MELIRAQTPAKLGIASSLCKHFSFWMPRILSLRQEITAFTKIATNPRKPGIGYLRLEGRGELPKQIIKRLSVNIIHKPLI